MNDDLISRSALLKAMEEERQFLLARGQKGAEHILVHHCLPIIDNAPTVDTYTEDDVHYAIKEGYEVGYGMAKAKFERPQGEWQLHGMIYYCSKCQHECGESGDNFCGNCGADMRGGKR